MEPVVHVFEAMEVSFLEIKEYRGWNREKQVKSEKESEVRGHHRSLLEPVSGIQNEKEYILTVLET